MKTYNIRNNDNLGDSIDSLALVITLDSEGKKYGSNWRNLESNTVQDLSIYDDFEEAQIGVVEEHKKNISNIVENLHQEHSAWHLGAIYEITNNRHHYQDGTDYKQTAIIERDSENRISLISINVSLDGYTYFDQFEEYLPYLLN